MAETDEYRPPGQMFAHLEAFRGLLALVVTVCHARGNLWIGLADARESGVWNQYSYASKLLAGLNLLTRFGHEAVVAFFVLSGFSIAHSLGRNQHPGRFFLRRFVRLYPAKVAALGWAALIFVVCCRFAPELFRENQAAFHLESDFLSVGHLIANLCYLPYGYLVSQFWSLPHEMVFYFLSPILLAPAIPRWFFIALGLCLAASFVPYADVKSHFFILFFCHYLALFMIGMFLNQRFSYFQTIFKNSNQRVMASAVTAVVCLIAFLQFRHEYEYIIPRDLLTGSVTALSILRLCNRNGTVPKFLAWLGRQSYSLYLSHMATIVGVIVLAKNLGWVDFLEPRPYVWVILVPPCLAVAELLFQLVEKPCQLWLERTRLPTSGGPMR